MRDVDFGMQRPEPPQTTDNTRTNCTTKPTAKGVVPLVTKKVTALSILSETEASFNHPDSFLSLFPSLFVALKTLHPVFFCIFYCNKVVTLLKTFENAKE